MTQLLGAFQITDFTPDHLAGAHRLSQQVSWPHRVEDWALTLSQSTGVVLCDGETVVGTALASVFGDIAMLSMIIVDERLRGQRLGRQLMSAVMDKVASRAMRLTATRDGLPLYEKLGFAVTGEILQFQGHVTAVAREDKVQTGAYDLDALAAMDQAASGLARKDLLTRIAKTGVVFHTPRGFAMLRDFGRGQVLGPIVAQDLATARALLAAAASHRPGAFLRIDTPEPVLGTYAEALGLTHVGGGTCMARDATVAPSNTTHQTFGLVSQALG